MKRSKLLYILRIIWEIGPAPNRDIAREAGYTPKDCYQILYRLKNDGYITHDEQEQYDISEEGLRTLTSEKKQKRFEFK